MRAKIIALFIQDPKQGTIEKTSINMDKNGVKEDKFYRKDQSRSILLTSTKSYEKAREQGIKINHGQLGENILLDANPCQLKEGTLLKIENVTLEITKPCTICKNLSYIDSKLPKILKKDRGIFAKIIKEGTINKNSTLSTMLKTDYGLRKTDNQ
ncbi:MAG: MOSC domain-containing protein [Proteobacteria bacterium]|nr:MAG: MOSC domain-containing protein [Pseudomonadota bacterium]